MEKILTVEIGGKEYKIVSEHSKEFIEKITYYTNNKLEEIVQANPKIPMSTAIVLTALNAAEDLYLEKDASDRIREQVTSYSTESGEYKYKMLEYKSKYEKALEELKKNGI